MGHTNSTANYNLPQFIGTDKPTWLGDVNGAMSAIDAAIANAASAATDAASVATNAATVAAGAVTTANAASETATAASTAASTATSTANTAADTANNAQSTAVSAYNTAGAADTKADAANSAIGDLTELDTTDKSSVVAAINEIVAEIPAAGGSVSVTADGTKTYAQLLKELFDLLDTSKITNTTMFIVNDTAYYPIRSKDATTVTFAAVNASATSLSADRIFLNTTEANCHFYAVSVSGSPVALTTQTLDANVPTSGSLAIYY